MVWREDLLNFFKPTIQNESIKELVDALNNVKSFQDSDLHLKGFANQLSLIHLKRIILMAYEENEDIELSAAVVKNLNRFLRLQGKFALQILKEAMRKLVTLIIFSKFQKMMKSMICKKFKWGFT